MCDKINRILNVGFGSQTYGTDFVDSYLSRPEVKKCVVDPEQLSYPDNIFDEVCSRCLLEHTKNVFDTLQEIVRFLSLLVVNSNYR